MLTYLQTNFVRVLMLMSMSSINLSKLVFSFVPMQNFSDASDIDWDKSISEIDKQLYAKYEPVSYTQLDVYKRQGETWI